MPKASPKATPKAALAVVELDQLTPDQMCTIGEAGAHLARLGKRAREEIEAIERIEKDIVSAENQIAARRQENSIRSLLVGVVLHQIKAALGHGKFRKWQGEHLKVKYRQATYLMKLAAVFVRLKGVLLPEVLALPQTTLDLTGGPKEAASALKKARAFVGNRSLNELLELHAVKMRGGYHPSEVAVEKWLADHHPKLAGKSWEQLDEELQLAYQASGYNERDWRTPEQIDQETREAAEASLKSPVSTLLAELDRDQWRQYVGPKQLTALRRELGDAVAKIDRLIAEMEGRG